jgi:hypothetical protein
LVGSWAQSCRAYIREPLTVRLTDSDSDDFLKNRISILSEVRMAFVVHQPAGFATVDLAAP